MSIGKAPIRLLIQPSIHALFYFQIETLQMKNAFDKSPRHARFSRFTGWYHLVLASQTQRDPKKDLIFYCSNMDVVTIEKLIMAFLSIHQPLPSIYLSRL